MLACKLRPSSLDVKTSKRDTHSELLIELRFPDARNHEGHLDVAADLLVNAFYGAYAPFVA